MVSENGGVEMKFSDGDLMVIRVEGVADSKAAATASALAGEVARLRYAARYTLQALLTACPNILKSHRGGGFATEYTVDPVMIDKAVGELRDALEIV